MRAHHPGVSDGDQQTPEGRVGRRGGRVGTPALIQVNYVYDAQTLLEFLTTIKLKAGPRIRQLEIYLFQYEVLRVPKYGELKSRF